MCFYINRSGEPSFWSWVAVPIRSLRPSANLSLPDVNMDDGGEDHSGDKPSSGDSDGGQGDENVEGASAGASGNDLNDPESSDDKPGPAPELGLPPPTWSNGSAKVGASGKRKGRKKKHCIRGGKLVSCGDRCPELVEKKIPIDTSPVNADADQHETVSLDDNGNPVEQGATANVPLPDAAPVPMKNHPAFKLLKSLGAIPKSSEYMTELKRKRSVLYQAILDYPTKPERLRTVLESGVSPNIEFMAEDVGVAHSLFIGYSPIHIACTEGNVAMLEDVIRYGADVDKIGRNGESALYYACVGCKISLVRGLLRHNADINITHENLGGETLLLATVACYDPKNDCATEYLEIARLLILAGADVNQSDYMDVSPLYIAVTKADTRMTRLLINSGAMLLASDNYEYATKLLMRAIDNDSEENVRLLISYGCDVNGVSQSHGLRHTPLDLAVVKNNLGIILDLLTAGAGEELNEPLHSAARNKHLVTLLLLIAKGGDVNARNNVDKATLMLTLTRARSEVGVDMLMRLGADPNYENTLGTTPLWAAVRANYPELVKKFILCNCNLNTTSIQHFLYRPITALQLTFELKFFDMSRWLLFAGCCIKSCWFIPEQLSTGLQDEPEMVAWLERWLHTPGSLRFLCRGVIRESVGLKLHKLLDGILYPDSLKGYIRLKDLEQEIDTTESLH